MKTKYIFIASILSFCFCLFAYSQWETQNPLPTGNDMDEIFFVDPMNGWIVCQDNYYHEHQPYILHTNDAGITWEGQECNTQESLLDIYFLDIHHGWAVGDNGTIILTTDGGLNWEVISNPTNENLRTIGFIDNNTGVAAGNEGTVLKTSDGGMTWETISLNSTISFCDLAMAGQKIWIIGDDNNSGDLYCSEDGGNTWEMVHTMITQNHWFSSVYFTDENNGFITECYIYSGGWFSYSGTIIRNTNDGGYTWRQVAHIEWDLLGSLNFCNSDFGWCKGYGDGHYKTEDGGLTWTSGHMGEYLYFRSVYCLDPNNVWLLSNGKLYYSDDNGDQWHVQLNLIKDSFQSVFFINSEKGWALGLNKLMYTENGGLEWELLSETIDGYDVFFTDEMHGWISSHNGLIYHTADGGLSWETQVSGTDEPLYSIHFTNNQNGWAGGGYNSNENTLLHTKDGGQNWHPHEIPISKYILSIFFNDEIHGWAVCGNYILYTTDGGELWETVNIQNLFDTYILTVYFVDNQIGWIAGGDGVILKTFDGGQTWEVQTTGVESRIKSLFFIDENHGWAAGGEYGPPVILHTTDGGDTWEIQCEEIGRWFTSIHFSDPENGWAVGFSGIIMHTDNGGAVWYPEYPENQNQSEISVYPNPSSGKIRLNYKTDMPGKVSIDIVNIRGELIESNDIDQLFPGEHQQSFDLTHLPDGMYLIRLQSGKHLQTKKVIILK